MFHYAQKVSVCPMWLALLCIWALFARPVSAQTKTWFFGDRTGVDFSVNPPQGIDGPIHTNEGCAAATNPNGKVIFSTDGKDVFDASGQKVFSGLMGDASSTHSAIIVPHPANPCKRFFVFTVGSAEGKSLNTGMHVVEIISNNGLLTISSPKKLHDYCTEKLAATPDGAGGYWLVSHDYIDTATATSSRGRRFFAYQITANSSLNNLVPVISTTGTTHEGVSPFGGNYWNSIGQMKFSRDGSKLALAIYARASVDILRFDKTNGRLYFLSRLDQFHQIEAGANIYGVEFSPNGNILYISTGYANPGSYGYVWGFDIRSLNATSMWNSRNIVAKRLSTPQNKYPFGALQMAPDNAIYIARNQQPFLDKILDPDHIANPGYITEAIALTDTCYLGLPTAIKSVDCSNSAWPCSYFSVDISVDTAICPEDSLRLGFDPQPDFQYRWNTGARTSFIYGRAGTQYRVGVTDTAGCYATSFFTIPESGNLEELNIPEDTALCTEVRTSLSFAYPGVKYKWQDGSDYEYTPVHTENVGVEFYSACDTLLKYIYAELSECSCEMYIPNAFTPNSDGLNDRFALEAACPLEVFQMEIYNRWGERVFCSNSIERSWDGKVGDRLAPPGTYVFVLTYESRLSDPVYEKGAVTLLK